MTDQRAIQGRADDAGGLLCPNCHQPMQVQRLPRHDHGTVRTDLCFVCSAIWFDHLVSVQLAPAAVIELFRWVHEHRGPCQGISGALDCPRCRSRLVHSFDLCKAGRFSYFSCPRDHGRLTPFVEFMREKQFVRSLTPQELQGIRAHVRQILCSQCGAPIDLEHSSECTYCHAPVSFIDPDAVEKAMHWWADAERRHYDPPTEDADERLRRQIRQMYRQAPPGGPGAAATDLIAVGIRALAHLI